MDMKNLIEIPFGLTGKIYRSPMPYGAFDIGMTTIDEMKKVGITKVVALVEEFEWWQHANIDLPQLYKRNQISMLHFPVVDFGAPLELKPYLELVQEVYALGIAGETIAVHCFAGIGRTGTFLAALACTVYGWQPLDAVYWVRKFIPNAVEHETQLSFLQLHF
jgi:protein-tyrosine phosphatase